MQNAHVNKSDVGKHGILSSIICYCAFLVIVTMITILKCMAVSVTEALSSNGGHADVTCL